jgi:hypothetical protein
MQCTSCGSTIYSGKSKCASCGTPIPDAGSEFSSYLSSDDPIPYIPYSTPTAPSQSSLTSEQKSRAQTTSQGSSKETSTLVPTQQPLQKGLSQYKLHPAFAGLLLLLISLLIFMGFGTIFYATIIHPNELDAHATAVAQDVLRTQANATAIAKADSPQTIYNLITKTNPLFTDALNGQQSSLWGNSSNGNSSCGFMNGSYHIRISANDFFYSCLSPGSNFTNYVFQVQLKLIKGVNAGIVFRSTHAEYDTYSYSISYTGLYALGVSYSSQQASILAFGRSSAIKTGLNQINMISVLLRGDEIDLFIKKQFVTNVHNQTFSSGAIGLDADNTMHISTDTVFSNVQVWNLP